MVETAEAVFGEEQAGITEFLIPATDQIQIIGTVKHRISDFIVNEIDENGQVVWFQSELNNAQKWKSDKTIQIEKDKKDLDEGKPQEALIPSDDVFVTNLNALVGEEHSKPFIDFV